MSSKYLTHKHVITSFFNANTRKYSVFTLFVGAEGVLSKSYKNDSNSSFLESVCDPEFKPYKHCKASFNENSAFFELCNVKS